MYRKVEPKPFGHSGSSNPLETLDPQETGPSKDPETAQPGSNMTKVWVLRGLLANTMEEQVSGGALERRRVIGEGSVRVDPSGTETIK